MLRTLDCGNHNHNILITGGAGYIGSHIALRLLVTTPDTTIVTIVDNLCRGSELTVRRLQSLYPTRLIFSQINGHDINRVRYELNTRHIDTIIHCAGPCYVAESQSEPLMYYREIVEMTRNLLFACRGTRVHTFLYSSSCAVYGNNPHGNETSALVPISPYGRAKMMAEWQLRDFAGSEDCRKSTNLRNIFSMRYFNVSGCDPNGRIGPLFKHQYRKYARLIDNMCMASTSNDMKFSIRGSDFPTRDGTAIRDYIHVWDLAQAHILSMNYHYRGPDKHCEFHIFNVGGLRSESESKVVGDGYSVNEILREFELHCLNQNRNQNQNQNQNQNHNSGLAIEQQSQLSLTYESRVTGDPAEITADYSKIKRILHWEPHYNIVDMLRHHWQWFCQFNFYE